MTVFVSRTLNLADGSSMEVQLHLPVRTAADEWVCEFSVGVQMQDAYGLDGLQALIVALDGVRAHLSRGPTVTWAGGEPGDFGVPRTVPQAFGLAFASHMDEIIDNELRTLVK